MKGEERVEYDRSFVLFLFSLEVFGTFKIKRLQILISLSPYYKVAVLSDSGIFIK